MSSSRPADDPIPGPTQEFIDSLNHTPQNGPSRKPFRVVPRRRVRCLASGKLFNYARELNGRAPSNVPAGDSPPGYDRLSDPYSASAIASVNNASSPPCFEALSGSEMCSTFTSV